MGDRLFTLQAVAPGDPGAAETLLLMRQLVRDATRDAGLIQEARRIVAAPSRDPADVVEGITDVLTNRVRYTDDPPFLELLQTPQALLEQLATRGVVYGDCDDTAILAAFLGVAHGLPFRFRAVGFQDPGPLIHVYTLLRVDGEWVTLDTTRNRCQATPSPVRGLEVEG